MSGAFVTLNLFGLAGIVLMVLTYIGINRNRFTYAANLGLGIACLSCPIIASTGFMFKTYYPKTLTLLLLIFGGCAIVSFIGVLNSWDNILTICLSIAGSIALTLAYSIVANSTFPIRVNFFPWINENFLLPFCFFGVLALYCLSIIGFYSNCFSLSSNIYAFFVAELIFLITYFCYIMFVESCYMSTWLFGTLFLLLFLLIIIHFLYLDSSSWIGGAGAGVALGVIGIQVITLLFIINSETTQSCLEYWIAKRPTHVKKR